MNKIIILILSVFFIAACSTTTNQHSEEITTYEKEMDLLRSKINNAESQINYLITSGLEDSLNVEKFICDTRTQIWHERKNIDNAFLNNGIDISPYYIYDSTDLISNNSYYSELCGDIH